MIAVKRCQRLTVCSTTTLPHKRKAASEDRVRGKGNMALVISKAKEGQTRQESARAAIEAYATKFDAPSRKGQHLDVDGILARSLPKTVSQLSCAKSVKEADVEERVG